MLVNVTVEVPDDPVALGLEPLCSLFVVRLATSVGITIKLNNKFAFRTEEVSDVVANRMLPAKLETVQPPVAEAPPDLPFRGSCYLTHLFGELEELRLDSVGSKCHGLCAKRPSP
jgi:hypothetical protein